MDGSESAVTEGPESATSLVGERQRRSAGDKMVTHKRPPGRAPSGKEWDAALGAWVDAPDKVGGKEPAPPRATKASRANHAKDVAKAAEAAREAGAARPARAARPERAAGGAEADADAVPPAGDPAGSQCRSEPASRPARERKQASTFHA